VGADAARWARQPGQGEYAKPERERRFLLRIDPPLGVATRSTGKSRRAFENGELSWTQDVSITYWVNNKKSAYNGKIGAFTQAYGGKRFGLGQLPKGDPQVPTVDKRR
jgi:hypothetical protein